MVHFWISYEMHMIFFHRVILMFLWYVMLFFNVWEVFYSGYTKELFGCLFYVFNFVDWPFKLFYTLKTVREDIFCLLFLFISLQI